MKAVQPELFGYQKPDPEGQRALDELFANASAYRNSREYFDLLKFISRFTRYSPYNAFLLHVQNPKVTYVATPSQWQKKHQRRLKPGAKPLLILAPMHPVLFVYDLVDTEGPPLPESFTAPFATEGDISPRTWRRTYEAVQKDGVLIASTRDFPFLKAGEVRRLDPPIDEIASTGRTNFYFRIVLNADLSLTDNYATLVHELGHVYLGHLSDYPGSWWKKRNVSSDQVELEAESVCYLVCRRKNIQTKSEQYLANKASENIELPSFSLEAVLKTAGKIEQMG